MPNIRDVKRSEMEEILDFYNHIEEYGHIYNYPAEKLDEPFKKILEGIAEVKEMMNDSWSM